MKKKQKIHISRSACARGRAGGEGEIEGENLHKKKVLNGHKKCQEKHTLKKDKEGSKTRSQMQSKSMSR